MKPVEDWTINNKTNRATFAAIFVIVLWNCTCNVAFFHPHLIRAAVHLFVLSFTRKNMFFVYNNNNRASKRLVDFSS